MVKESEVLEELKSAQELREWLIKYGEGEPSVDYLAERLCIIIGTLNWVLGHYTTISENINKEMEAHAD